MTSARSIVGKIRNIIPLRLRIWIGPFIAYTVYKFNLYFRKNRKRPHVLNIEETVELIKKDNLSAIRFGDGEMSLIENQDLGFQQKNNDLSKKLSEVLRSNIKGLLICIPGIWENIDDFSKRSYWFTLHHLFRHGQAWMKFVSTEQTYGDAFITRPYLNYKDKDRAGRIFNKLFSIWENKDVVLVEGSKSRLGVGNDMFKNVKSLKRILGPSENAYTKHTELLQEVQKFSKDHLILLSLGPAAKVLAYDLFLLGYRVIDIGHIDMEYEMYRRNSETIIKVPGKYFNEINERNPEECSDPEYLSQISAKIE